MLNNLYLYTQPKGSIKYEQAIHLKFQTSKDLSPLQSFLESSGGSVVKNLPANAGDAVFITGSGRSPGGGSGNPLQYCLGDPMDRRAGWVTAHGVTNESDMTDQLSKHLQAFSGSSWRRTLPK